MNNISAGTKKKDLRVVVTDKKTTDFLKTVSEFKPSKEVKKSMNDLSNAMQRLIDKEKADPGYSERRHKAWDDNIDNLESQIELNIKFMRAALRTLPRDCWQKETLEGAINKSISLQADLDDLRVLAPKREKKTV